MSHINKQKKISNAMLIVMLAGVLFLILFLTKAIDTEFSEILFLVPGLSATFLGLIFYFVFKHYAEEFDKIVQGNKYLAKWHVDSFVWTNFIEKDYKFNQDKSFKMIKITLFVFIPVIIIGCIMIGEYFEMMLFTAIMSGTVLLTTAIVYLVNFQKYQARKNNSSADIIVTEKALIINSEFYFWTVWGSRFEYLKYQEEENMLQFVYSVSSKSGRINQEINVPIGNSEQEQLNKIREHFSDKIKA
jgi:hypothetical protein